MNDTFKALSDPTRRHILSLLKKWDMTVNEILKHFKVTQEAISHHLSVLKNANLVIAEKKGQFVSYSLNISVAQETIQIILDLLQ